MALTGSRKAGPSGGTKLTLAFSLVNVPVRLKPLTEAGRPIKGKTMCPDHGPTCSSPTVCSIGEKREHVLTADQKQTGYPHPEDPKRYVVVPPSVMDEIAASMTGRAQIERLVDADFDPLYVSKTYLVWPDEGGEEAFDLLTAYLASEGKAAVATTVLSKTTGTQTLVFRWSEATETVVAHVVTFSERIRAADAEMIAKASSERPVFDEANYEMAKGILSGLEGDFDAGEVVDTYTPLLRDAIRAAAEGETYVVAEPAEAAPTVDLMAALKASIEESKPKRKSRAKAKAA